MVAAVNIMVVGRTYEISCDEGQEDDVRGLAAEVDRRATDLLRSVGQVGDSRLLVMVCLMMADEIGELKRHGLAGSAHEDADATLSIRLEALARQIEAIADRVEKS